MLEKQGSANMDVIARDLEVKNRLDEITEKGVCKGVFFDWAGSLYCSYDTTNIFKQFEKLHNSGIPVFVMTMCVESEDYYRERFQKNGVDIDNLYIVNKRLLRDRKVMVAVDDDNIALTKYHIDPSNVDLCCIALNRVKTSYLKEQNITLDRKSNVITDKDAVQKELDSIEMDGFYPAIFFEGHGTLYKDKKAWDEILWQVKEIEDHDIPFFIVEKGFFLEHDEYVKFFENAGINMNNIYVVSKEMLKNKQIMVSVESDYLNSTRVYGISQRKMIDSSNRYWCISHLEDFTEFYRQGVKEVKASQIKPLKECIDFDRVGAKAQTLADLSRYSKTFYNVPCGDVLTQHFFTEVYKEVIPEIDDIVFLLNNDVGSIQKASEKIEKLIDSVDIADEISNVDYNQKRVVRSSGNYEDGANASFAGVYESILNVEGKQELIDAVQKVIKSFYSPSALDYYIDIVKSEDYPAPIRPAIILQTQVNAQYSGVMFSSSPVKGDDYIHVNIIEGLGDELLSGTKKGYEIYINKNTREVEGDVEILEKLPVEDLKKALASVKSYFKNSSLYANPNIDAEFAIDKDDRIHLLQARPVTVGANDIEVVQHGNLSILKSTCDDYVCGCVCKIEKEKDIENIKEGDIVVISDIKTTDFPYLKKASAIIMESSRQAELSHAAVLLREIVAKNNIVAVIGKNDGILSVKNGSQMKLSSVTGRLIEYAQKTRF